MGREEGPLQSGLESEVPAVILAGVDPQARDPLDLGPRLAEVLEDHPPAMTQQVAADADADARPTMSIGFMRWSSAILPRVIGGSSPDGDVRACDGGM